MKKQTLCMVAACALLASSGYAQTVTVSKSGTPDYATITAALAHFNPDPDALTPNVIQILDGELYDEAIQVGVPVTIEGVGVDRPVLACQLTVDNDGLAINTPGDGDAVTLRNLIIIPSRTNTPGDDLIRVINTLNLNLTLEDLVVTSNNGSDQPVTLDGLSPVDLTGATQTGDDGMFLAGTGTVATLTRVVVSHHAAIPGSQGDGLVCSGVAASYLIGEGCVFSYNGRLGIQANADFTIDAPNDRVWIIGNQGFAGLWYAGIAAGATQRLIDGVNVLNNAHVTLAFGWGIEHQNGGGVPFILRNAILAGNKAQGLVIGGVGTTTDMTLENVTIANNGTNPISVDAAATGNIFITDSVITGGVLNTGTGSIVHGGTGTLDVSFSALATSGIYALASPPTSGTGPTNIASVINDDPIFVSDDGLSPDGFDVDNPAYGGAGTAGSDLAGGADYIGSFTVPASADTMWNIYQ